MLVRLSRASRVLEVGCFSGYAALWMGLALPEGGRLLSLERDECAAEVAERHLAAAGLGECVEVRLGDAMASLEALPANELPYDIVFLDADKKRSFEYLDLLLSRNLVARDGLLLVDNVLWKGQVLDRLDPTAILATSESASTLPSAARRSMGLRDALHDFSVNLSVDDRVHQFMLPVRDGLTWVQLQEGSGMLPTSTLPLSNDWDGSLEDKLAAYLRLVGSSEPACVTAMRDEVHALPSGMDISLSPQVSSSAAECGTQEGRLLHMLVRLSRASRVLEVGCFSGYAALWMGLALPEGGRLLSLERDECAAEVAERHLAAAGLGECVEVRLGDAMASLEALPANEPPYDLIVISSTALANASTDHLRSPIEHAMSLLASHGLAIVLQPPEALQSENQHSGISSVLHSLSQGREVDLSMVTLPSPDGKGGTVTLLGRMRE